MINLEARKSIFKNYLAMGDIARQLDFINQYTTEIKLKYRYPCENCNSERKMRVLNNAFCFQVDKKKIRVCKQFFKTTLDINDRVIKTVTDKTNLDGFVFEGLRGKHNNRYNMSEETDTVRKFISAIPRVESHYLRPQTTREFIEGGKTLTQLYDDYFLRQRRIDVKFVFLMKIVLQQRKLKCKKVMIITIKRKK